MIRKPDPSMKVIKSTSPLLKLPHLPRLCCGWCGRLLQLSGYRAGSVRLLQSISGEQDIAELVGQGRCVKLEQPPPAVSEVEVTGVTGVHACQPCHHTTCIQSELP